jgi:hypothetical protein
LGTHCCVYPQLNLKLLTCHDHRPVHLLSYHTSWLVNFLLVVISNCSRCCRSQSLVPLYTTSFNYCLKCNNSTTVWIQMFLDGTRVSSWPTSTKMRALWTPATILWVGWWTCSYSQRLVPFPTTSFNSCLICDNLTTVWTQMSPETWWFPLIHHKRDGDTWVPSYPIWAPPTCAIYYFLHSGMAAHTWRPRCVGTSICKSSWMEYQIKPKSGILEMC